MAKVIKKFKLSVTMLLWNKTLWLDVGSHVTNFNQIILLYFRVACNYYVLESLCKVGYGFFQWKKLQYKHLHKCYRQSKGWFSSAVVVAKQKDQSLPAPLVLGSNPFISIYLLYRPGMTHFETTFSRQICWECT